MKLELPEIRPEERTPLVECLLAIIQQLLDRVQQLEETVQQVRDEMAILKGQKPRPQLRPSRLESATPEPRPAGPKRPGSEKSSQHSRLTIVDPVRSITDLPVGAVFKGDEPYVVQERTLTCQATRYLRAR
jgi:hypothetical protein